MFVIAYVRLGGPFDENYTFHDKVQIDAMNEKTFFVAKEQKSSSITEVLLLLL